MLKGIRNILRRGAHMRWDAVVVFVLALMFFEGLAYLIGKGRKAERTRSAKIEILAQSSNNRHPNPGNSTSLHC
jgi:hypothetical protein